MKVGDKLICKETVEHNKYSSENYRRVYFFGKEYTIKNIHSAHGVFITMDNSDRGMWFHINRRALYQDEFFLWDHFYTPQELRIAKLKKLYERAY